jgi:L-Ala-D/L-Glu epimerase
MKIVDVRWHSYRLPLINSFSTAHGVMTTREGIIVLVTTERGITGIGEIAPLPAFGGGSFADATKLLPALATRFYKKTLHEALDLLLPEKKAGAASTLCGLEIALLDAIGKTQECQVCALLSPPDSVPRATVEVNAVIGSKTTETASAAARNAVGKGFHCIKLKVGYGVSIREEIERVAAVRDAIGPAAHLRLDANEAWMLEEAVAILSQCVQYDIQYVEQPLKARDLAGMRALRQTIPIPLAVDEALCDPQSASLVLDSEAADVLVIKPQLAGGLRAGQQIINTATERGVRCIITGTLEAGVGLAAALHLAAASPALTLECGLATLHLLGDDLIIDGLAVRDGFMAVPTGVGLGVALDWDALHRYSL